jgi:signal transduction histidine kinase
MSLPATPGAHRFLAVLFGVPVAFSVLFFVMNTLAENNDSRRIVMDNLDDQVVKLRSIAHDAELGEHGFLLTGEERYRIMLESATRLFQQISPSNVRDRALNAQLQKVFHLVDQRIQMANDVVRIEQTSGFPAALEAARGSKPEKATRDMRTAIDSLRSEINKKTSEVYDDYRRLTRVTFLLFLFGTLFMLLAMVWLYNSFLGYMQARDAANVELQKLNVDLEQRISDRTRQLQEFNDELQQFAYVASHDLQEPLRTVTSFTQLLASRYKGKLDQDADEFMDYIVNSARRMTDLINGLLALVRLRKSGQPSTPVCLNALVEEAEVSLQASIRESGARIEVAQLPSLIVNGVQFAQVMQNLISNAIKYRRDEPPLVRISARLEQTNWIISVQDNGRGFDPQFAERIFGLFQRLHSREVDGTGMGLTIVRRIVERHGGRIWAESLEGAGSTFHLSLPTSLESRAADSRHGDVNVEAAEAPVQR